MTMDVRAAVTAARAETSDGGTRITPNEARAILTQARSEGISEGRLRSALGRAYEAPIARALGEEAGAGNIALNASDGTHVRMSTVLAGAAGVVSVGFDITPNASDRMIDLGFARLVGQMYGLPPGEVTSDLLSSPALRGLRAEYTTAARAGGSHTFHFPPSLTRPPEAP